MIAAVAAVLGDVLGPAGTGRRRADNVAVSAEGVLATVRAAPRDDDIAPYSADNRQDQQQGAERGAAVAGGGRSADAGR